MSPTVLPLAYKYVALALMLGEINFFGTSVGLRLDHPIVEQDVRNGSHVGPPKTNDFGGSVLTDAYFFGFGWGHLANFRRNDFRSDSSTAIRERNARLSKEVALIDSPGAYQLATNWLTAIGLHVPTLEKKYKLKIVQWQARPEGLSTHSILLPVYQIEWRGSPFKEGRGRTDMAVATMTILGTTKELIEYHVLDDSLFLRPGIQIPEFEGLLAMPDGEFEGMDSALRKNLLSRYSPNSKETALPSNSAP